MRHGAPESDAAYQHRLALSLIDTVGYDGALRYCRNNAWDGVLHSIQCLRGEIEPTLRA